MQKLMLCQRLCFQPKHDQKDHNNSAKDWLKGVRNNLENFPPFLQLPSPSCSQNRTVFTELWDFHINGLSEGLDIFIVKKVALPLFSPNWSQACRKLNCREDLSFVVFWALFLIKTKGEGWEWLSHGTGNGQCDPLTPETAKIIQLPVCSLLRTREV